MDAGKEKPSADAAAMLLSDDVHICLEKNAGSETFRHSFVASSTMAALSAIGIIVVDLANMLEVAPADVLASLTMTLLGSSSEDMQVPKVPSFE